jgi:dihydroorotate dehydrogenase (fumarate)
VMRSLFAEQIAREELSAYLHLDSRGESFAEALSYFPSPERFVMGPDEYLAHLGRVKAAVGIPVIASLNGTRPGSWRDYPQAIEQSGADALELNIYHLPTDPHVSGDEVEELALQAVREVKRAVRIPVAVKISPFFSAIAHFAARLDAAGADGIVLFNRFYQPDIDPEELSVVPSLQLSRSSELPLRLRWLAILSGRVRASLAVTGGVHDGADALKAVMAGAHVVQMVSALLLRGPEHLGRVRHDMAQWLEEHEYGSLAQARGSMNLVACPDPAAYERANYMAILQGWTGARATRP